MSISRLICISGPDGVGKTTQARILLRNFDRMGVKYEYKWMRFNHFFSFPILFLARVLGLSEMKTLKNNKKMGYHYFYRSKLISYLYLLSLSVDTIFFTVITIYIPLNIFNKNFICDRCSYDTLIDLMISIGKYNLYKSWIGRIYFILVPKKSKIIVLNTDKCFIEDRRDDIKCDANILLKINLYFELAKYFGIYTIDAQQSIETINEQISSYIR